MTSASSGGTASPSDILLDASSIRLHSMRCMFSNPRFRVPAPTVQWCMKTSYVWVGANVGLEYVHGSS
jgi:hypothetical protein